MTWEECLSAIENMVEKLIRKYKDTTKAKDPQQIKSTGLAFIKCTREAEKKIKEHLNMLACKMREMDKKGYKRNTPETSEILRRVMIARKKLTDYKRVPSMYKLGEYMRKWGNRHMGHVIRTRNSGTNCGEVVQYKF